MPETVKLTKRSVIAAANEYAEAQAVIERCKPLLIEAMGENSQAIAGNRVLKLTRTAAKDGVPAYKITTAMVGETIPAKRAVSASVRLKVE